MKYFNTVLPEETWGDLDDFYKTIVYDDTIINKLRAPLGVKELDRLDIEYLYYILAYNQKGGPYTRRPGLDIIDVNFITEERVYVTYTRTEEIETYAPLEVDNNYLHSLENDQVIEPWHWEVTDEDTRDSDVRESYFEV